MAQEFTIKSEAIEDKINQLLPSQGGFGAGVDFSASTMVIPVVDLTETAEGSALRQDLQRSLSLTSATTFNVQNATTTIINTTGYWQVTASFFVEQTSGVVDASIQVTDGITTKKLFGLNCNAGSGGTGSIYVNELVKLEAGESLQGFSTNFNAIVFGSVRQIADVNGNLTNP